ncbi:MAG: hypothetical protein CL910_21840 [Deltaproteobacteria bacterium]|nr:hypothetical protein [Deltaproteobacteria bacterium]
MKSPRPPTRGDGETAPGWLWLAALCAAVLAYWAIQYQPFVLPNNDYHSFERVARSFAELELPSSFKRMPVLPALMALLAPWMPEPHPYLHAALVWNQLFSLGVLVGLFLLGRRTLGRAGWLLPLLFATTTQFHANGLQPLVEPSLGFFVVWAFVLQGRGSPWQYAAAFGAALSRYEAALLIPVLFLAEWSERRELWPPLWKAALATSGLLLWAGAGALLSSGGGSSYYELMSGMGFEPAPGFFVRSLKEPFAGWYTGQWIWRVVFAGVVLLPLLAGVVVGLRERKREMLSVLGFGVLCVATIVVFGINKARYVYPTEWIWLFFWLWGAIQLGGWVKQELEKRPAALAWGAAGFAALLALGSLLFWLRKMSGEPQTSSLGVELAFVACALGLALAALWPRGSARPAVHAAFVAGFGLALVPLISGGLVGKQRAVHKIAYANWSAYRVADWLGEHLQPDDRVVLLPRTHIQYLLPRARPQLRSYSQLEAEDADAMRAEFLEKGLTVAVFTDRGPLRNPSHHYYYREKKTYLAEVFESGAPVPGFRHVGTLTLPPHIDRKPVQIYRFTDAAGG